MKRKLSILLLLMAFFGCSKTESPPAYLYKVVSVEDWEQSCGTVRLSSMDDAFIHLATKAQLPKILDKYWSGVPEYVVLKVKTSKLPGRLVFETNPGGETKYYHLYDGSIPLDAVVDSKIHSQ